MKFIVANYGARHAGLLIAHLQSVAESHPGAQQVVYWQDMPARLIDAIRTAYPAVDFVQTEYDFAGDSVQRIASKTLCWARAAEEHASQDALVFADSDTIVRLDLRGYFDCLTEDVIFTHKPDESAPINTGVMLARGGAATTGLFAEWRDRTLEVLRDPESKRQATDPSLPYAAPDQMSFFQMIGYERGRADYTACGAKLRAELCARLNETNSRPLTGDVAVVHYKAGWQQILLNGRPFSKWRPREASWEMLTLFLQTFDAALSRVNAATDGRFSPEDFSIRWPWYWTAGKFNPSAYAAWRVKAAAERAWLMLTGRLAPGT